MTTPIPRRCVGSTSFGIEPHEAPTSDFPAQPSQPLIEDVVAESIGAHPERLTDLVQTRALTVADVPRRVD